MKKITIALLAMGLGACAEIGDTFEAIEQFPPGTTLQKAKRTTPQTDQHGQTLYDGYIYLAGMEYDEGDYRDSDFFADRAIIAAKNQQIEPQQIGARDLSFEVLNEAAMARRKLTVVRYKGGSRIYPILTAEAQLGFDCWLQEMEEGFQPKDIAACRVRYESAMNRIEEAERLAKAMSMVVPSDSPKPLERMTFDIFFDFDSDKPIGQAQSHVAIIARVIKEFKNPVVAVIGNADQVGQTDYNLKLSQRRAEAVAAILRANGVEPSGIFARGDQAPEIDKLDRSAEHLNRVVVISVREGI